MILFAKFIGRGDELITINLKVLIASLNGFSYRSKNNHVLGEPGKPVAPF